MLQFVGTGSAFNTELGNTSAFVKEGESMFLIDCGSSTFKTLKESGLLIDVKYLNVFITHTHADHVGSLADLIFYMYYVMGAKESSKVKIYTGSGIDVEKLLTINGINTKEHCVVIKLSKDATITLPNFRCSFINNIEYNNHVDEIHCVGFEFHHNGTPMYYSGDTTTLNPRILDKIKKGHYDFVYVDTSFNDIESRVHMHYSKLDSLLDGCDYRNRVYCMHLDVLPEENLEIIKELGFGIARNFPRTMVHQELVV